MKQLFYNLVAFFKRMESKIAFYPVIFAVGGAILSYLMISLDQSNTIIYEDYLNYLALKNSETALTVLSVCASGIISIMVFSFSMVMLLLSQASNNFSPRLLPGLISERKHQFIIGIYLATTIYCILIILSIKSVDEDEILPTYSLLLGIFLTISCIGLFIYFIHNISQRIQINKILENIYYTATAKLDKIITKEGINSSHTYFPDTVGWKEYASPVNGYLQTIALKNLKELCVESDNRLFFHKPKGFFIQKGTVLFSSENELDQHQLRLVLSNLHFSEGEFIFDNYLLAYKQITEIAIKAMSAGINDPGTAINAIDYLSVLLTQRMLKNNISNICSEKHIVIRIKEVTFNDLLYNLMASFRTYCKHDPVIVQKLLLMLLHLKNSPTYDKDYYRIIDKEAKNLKEDSDKNMTNMEDLQVIATLYEKFNK